MSINFLKRLIARSPYYTPLPHPLAQSGHHCNATIGGSLDNETGRWGRNGQFMTKP